ncbi:RNA polymerase sigma-70 factor [uncultured Parabacteroides sp.]|uniref:RNA polymerase sigma-70 factor n=1 Tax=uncultured Parabacteroides sp. TaxID=512312 RepID=UPI00261E7453|nr:RNA polymerase sigma-70 factor [uncultured Parabacteroides sp.]
MKGVDFNSIYERNYRRSFLFTKSYVHDDMAAEDIVAESLVKYWRLSTSQKAETSEALLLTILRNKALDYLRHKAIHESAIENITELNNRELNIRISTLEACDPEQIFSREIQIIIHNTLKSLPEQTRRVFEMSRFENKTVKEIAEETNLTVKGVEYHITKALKVLRTNLKDYLPLLYFLFS